MKRCTCTCRRLVQRLAEEDPPAFLCHFYNIYFAHSAGGRMIGKKVSEMCLDGAQLQFYQYNGELKELLEKVLPTFQHGDIHKSASKGKDKRAQGSCTATMLPVCCSADTLASIAMSVSACASLSWCITAPICPSLAEQWKLVWTFHAGAGQPQRCGGDMDR